MRFEVANGYYEIFEGDDLLGYIVEVNKIKVLESTDDSCKYTIVQLEQIVAKIRELNRDNLEV